jgi:ribosomal protein L3 glutamine methyltransferase
VNDTQTNCSIANETLEEAIADLNTINDFIRWGYSQFNQNKLFYGHGTDNPWDESVSLVLQTLGLPFDTPDIILQTALTTSEKTVLSTRIGLRINKKIPVAYLTNKALFCGSEYYVDERVLIPRSPIGELIEQYFQPWIDPDRVGQILDLCTGSGCIAIACAQYFPDAIVDAGDISSDCIDVSEINRISLEQDNVAFYQSDLFEQIPHKKYDIIVSNPPYVDAEDFESIPTEFLQEPKLGLTSGNDGLDLTRRILQRAYDFLAEEGVLIVEVGNSALALQDSFPELEFIWLDFERGGDGVFLLKKEQLKAF